MDGNTIEADTVDDFIAQFIRNNLANRRLVPTVSVTKEQVRSSDNGVKIVVIQSNDKSSRSIIGAGTARFIHINNEGKDEYYQLLGVTDTGQVDPKTRRPIEAYAYVTTKPLGINNNTLEYHYG
jgi:hypothetical protein